MVSPKRSVSIIAVVLILLVLSVAARLQEPTIPLVKIDFVGLQKVDKDHAINATGLKIGQLVSKSDLDTANKQLLGSGLFTKSKYKYRQYEDKFEVTFQVEEAEASTSVTFDNFVWFTDKELADAVKKELPTFNGNAPDGEGAIESIKKALRQLLKDHNLPGEIDYTSYSSDLSAKQTEHVFSVKGISLPICSIHYLSASAVPESVLVANSKDLIKKDYSVKYVIAYTDALQPIYRRIGHLRASFDAPTAKLESAAGCSGGVSVSVNVSEGLAYDWGRPEWSGNQALTTAELEKVMQMKPGELADGEKIDNGLKRIHKVYGRKGYLTVRIAQHATFFDEQKTVSYSFKITDGPQYHMGKLTVTGFSDSQANKLKELWTIAEGAVFDGEYYGDYQAVAFARRLERNSQGKLMSIGLKFNQDSHTVDVTIGVAAK